MRLTAFSATGYRSLREVQLPIRQVNLFVGKNGVGKSNLYRALQLIRCAALNTLAREIAAEGGMVAVRWAGPKRADQKRIVLAADFDDDNTGLAFRYTLEIGFPIAGEEFDREPLIKAEEIVLLGENGRKTRIMERRGPAIFLRQHDGRWGEFPVRPLPSETALALVGSAGAAHEVSALRSSIAGWRFYHGLRSDHDSPLRKPSPAVMSPTLDEDGANLAAVLRTRSRVGDREDLDAAIEHAMPGASLVFPAMSEYCTFALRFAEFEHREFSPIELSDGQIRFAGLSGALLAHRLPMLIALNEPEASLHPDMLPALASMIARAAERTQVWIVTHSQALADAIAEETGATAREVTRTNGATGIAGMPMDGSFDEE